MKTLSLHNITDGYLNAAGPKLGKHPGLAGMPNKVRVKIDAVTPLPVSMAKPAVVIEKLPDAPVFTGGPEIPESTPLIPSWANVFFIG